MDDAFRISYLQAAVDGARCSAEVQVSEGMLYAFVPEDSEIHITGHAPLHDVHATSKQICGEFEATFSGNTPMGNASGFAQIDVNTFKSGSRLVEFNTLRHIKANRYPTARFDIDTVAVPLEAPADTVHVMGTMSFCGEQVKVFAEPIVTVEGDIVAIEGDWQLCQSAFGLKPPRLAMLKVGDAIDVHFRLIARRLTASRSDSCARP